MENFFLFRDFIETQFFEKVKNNHQQGFSQKRTAAEPLSWFTTHVEDLERSGITFSLSYRKK